MNNLEILGVKIDNLTRTEVLQKIRDFLNSDKGHYAVTINAEFLVCADKDEKFNNILNNADLKVIDGFGPVLAVLLKNQKIKARLAGADLLPLICEIAEQNNCSVFLLGGLGNTAELAGEKLKKQFPKLNIVGAEQGLIFSPQSLVIDRSTQENENLINRINNARPAILFVAFGHPKQEKWIYENLGKMPSVRLAMGVGGTFDYLAGKTRRAPKFMRNLGLEWLFRLFIEPWRIKRIFRAVFVFLTLVIWKDILKIR